MVSKLARVARVLALCLLCLPLCGAWPNSGKKFGAAYTGPGDVVASATFWYGLRAYTTALANAGASTTKVIDVLGSTTVTGCTIFLRGNGTGGLDLTTAGAGGVGNQCLLGATTFCTSTNANCSISKWYDQTGNSHPVIQPTAANQPLLAFSCVGSNVCINVSSTAYTLAQLAAGVSQAQPYSSAMVLQRYANFTSQIYYFGADDIGTTLGPQFTSNNVANQVHFSTWTSNTFVSINGTGVTDSKFNAISSVFHGASPNSNVYSNGTTVTGTFGADAIQTGAAIRVAALGVGASPAADWYALEWGIWPVAFSGANQTSMCQNQQTFYGTANFGATC